MSSKNTSVSINVFPTLDYIELVQFDGKTGELDKATSLPCQFDITTRQMVDRDQMAQTIRDLYNLNRVPLATPTVLVLPSFFTREIELPSEFSRDELRFALVSEAERFYIFKKVEPQIDWINLDESRLLYSAFPKPEIEKYTQIFQELHIPLIGIEMSYFSMIRGLIITGVISGDDIANRMRWCLLTLNDHSFFASIQEGLKIQKSTEAPLSVSAEDDETAISEVQQDFSSFVANESFDRLILVNNSHTLNSERIVGMLSNSAELILIEQNGLTLRSRNASEGQFPCSLEALGGIFHRQFPELSGMNFMSDIGEDVASIMHYRKAAVKLLLIANGAIFVLCLVLWGILSLIVWQKEQEALVLAKESGKLEGMANTQQLLEVDRKKFIKQIVDQNAKTNNFMVKLGSATPQDVWMEKVQLEADQPDHILHATLEGKALALDQVNQLLQSLNSAISDTVLEITNAAPATSAEGQAYFTWGIKNKGSAPNTSAPAVTPPGGP